ncbi:hypothetical protein Efla_003385 [Eimeria flavescens]
MLQTFRFRCLLHPANRRGYQLSVKGDDGEERLLDVGCVCLFCGSLVFRLSRGVSRQLTVLHFVKRQLRRIIKRRRSRRKRKEMKQNNRKEKEGEEQKEHKQHKKDNKNSTNTKNIKLKKEKQKKKGNEKTKKDKRAKKMVGKRELTRVPCPDMVIDDIGSAFCTGFMGGFLWHFTQCWPNSPRCEKFSGAMFSGCRKASNHGSSFATWGGGIICPFDCTLIHLRSGKQDSWNSVLAGAATGGFLFMRTGWRSCVRNSAWEASC